jgi:hypothetical protein
VAKAAGLRICLVTAVNKVERAIAANVPENWIFADHTLDGL